MALQEEIKQQKDTVDRRAATMLKDAEHYRALLKVCSKGSESLERAWGIWHQSATSFQEASEILIAMKQGLL